MIVLQGRNVNELYRKGLNLLYTQGHTEKSRAGEVLVLSQPVTSVYYNPTERVLFDYARDANPFFHLLEAMWMLAGRQDGKWLDEYVHDFSSRFAEQYDGRIHGAYGYRWRCHFDLDQIETIVLRLKEDPKDRRVVIGMWDPNYDLGEPGEEQPRDLPCNTHIYPRVVYHRGKAELDFTVCCRSNDAVWGAYGANAVHFSFLQEYMAAGLGVQVGTLYQISNNLHMYKAQAKSPDAIAENHYGQYLRQFYLVDNYPAFKEEVQLFCDGRENGFLNTFLQRVASPMRKVNRIRKEHGAQTARLSTNLIEADDWRMAAEQWLERRIK